MANSSAARAHLTLVPEPSHIRAETHAPSPDSWDDRRSSIRRTLSELTWLTQIRVQYGPAVSLLDLSTGGAQIEATAFRLQPGSTVVVQLATESETVAIPALVLRSQVSRLLPAGARYRTALAFKRRLALADFLEEEKSRRDPYLAHEHAQLNVALRRLEASMAPPGGASGPAITEVGRGALAAALAIMESPSGRPASGTFSRELGRLLRVITLGLTNGTVPHVILDQMVEKLRRAVPAKVIRVANGMSLADIPAEATCFDVPSPVGGSPASLVVECPRGCRLDSEHLPFLKAAAYLVTLITQVGMMGTRDRAASPATSGDLPVGWKRLVVRYLDGRMLKGFTNGFSAASGNVHVWIDPNAPESSRITVSISQLKTIFFVHDLEGDPAHRPGADAAIGHGRRVEVTFVDGEVLMGRTLTYSTDGRGFFVTPLDSGGNNVRIFIAPAAVQQVTFP